MLGKSILKYLVVLFFLLGIKLVHSGDRQTGGTLFSHMEIGLHYGITPFDSQHDMPMHYQFDVGYRFHNKSAVLISINLYQLWNEGEQGDNYRSYPGKYYETILTIAYRAYLNKIVPVKYFNQVSIGSGVGINRDATNSLSISLTPAYNFKLSRSFTMPVGLIFIYNPNPPNIKVYTNNYWGIFLGIHYHWSTKLKSLMITNIQ